MSCCNRSLFLSLLEYLVDKPKGQKMNILKRINPKYIFFSVFILCLAFLDVIKDIILPRTTGEIHEMWRDIWHWLKRFGIFNVALIFLWEDIVSSYLEFRVDYEYKWKFFRTSIFYPALWLMLIAFILQVIPYNWLFGGLK